MRVVLSFVAGPLPGLRAGSAVRAGNSHHAPEDDADLYISAPVREMVESTASRLRGLIHFVPYPESAA